MSLAHTDDLAMAAYEDAELLLTAILPDARITQVGLSGDGVDVGVAVPLDSLAESLGVLVEAGYLPCLDGAADERQATLAAPGGAIAVTLHLVESGARRDSPAPLQAA
jgi:hypothetical protein